MKNEYCVEVAPDREIRTEATCSGAFVVIEIPSLFCGADDAERIAQALILAASIVRARNVEPATRPLPLSEPFALQSVGDSSDRDAAPGDRCGDNFAPSMSQIRADVAETMRRLDAVIAGREAQNAAAHDAAQPDRRAEGDR